MMVSSPSLIHDILHQGLLFFCNMKMKTKGLEVQKVLLEPKATPQSITLGKTGFQELLWSPFHHLCNDFDVQTRGKLRNELWDFPLRLSRVDSAPADSKGNLCHCPASLAGVGAQSHMGSSLQAQGQQQELSLSILVWDFLDIFQMNNQLPCTCVTTEPPSSSTSRGLKPLELQTQWIFAMLPAHQKPRSALSYQELPETPHSSSALSAWNLKTWAKQQ